MFYIENNVIQITKGDTAAFNVDITAGNEAYTMNTADKLTLTVRALPSEKSKVLLKIETIGNNRIGFSPEDTKNLMAGRYSADIQLNDAYGNVYTVWPKLTGEARYGAINQNNFIIMPEVTT